MTDNEKLRAAFHAGFDVEFKVDHKQYDEDLKTMYGICLQAEMVHYGFEKFLKILPELETTLDIHDKMDFDKQRIKK